MTMNERRGAATIIVDQYQNASKINSISQSYKGLPIHALPGLHEFMFSKLALFTPIGGSVLDVAAGSGAMSLRLKDAGYGVTATDYVTDNFRLHESISFFKADLNLNFSSGRENIFDSIIATEIIEHIENPRHFARECFKLLKPSGKLILSTPNVDSVASIVSHMRHGTYQWFSDADYKHDGHISPLMQWQIDKCFVEAGFVFSYKGSYGDRYDRLEGSPRLILLAKLVNLLSTLQDELKGQIFVAVCEKK